MLVDIYIIYIVIKIFSSSIMCVKISFSREGKELEEIGRVFISHRY